MDAMINMHIYYYNMDRYTLKRSDPSDPYDPYLQGSRGPGGSFDFEV